MKTYDEMEVRFLPCHSYLQRWKEVAHYYKARSANPQGRSPNGLLRGGLVGYRSGPYNVTHKQNFLVHNKQDSLQGGSAGCKACNYT